MACFLVGAAEAIVVTAAAKAVKAAELRAEPAGAASIAASQEKARIPWSRKLMWLAYLLWGGAFLLAMNTSGTGKSFPGSRS